MNYRHAYHAGNFGDVLKHIVLTLVMEHLIKKETPFRVVDLHAGIGLYDLLGEQAAKTGEWRDGIARILASGETDVGIPPAAICGYLDIVRRYNSDTAIGRYPGSPMIARSMLRPEDVLVVNELHPDDNQSLWTLFKDDEQVRVLNLDAWVAIKSLLPPKERRGLILIDPPFEHPREFDSIVDGLREALKRFASGIYLIWYPIKDRKPVDRFLKELAEAVSRPTLVSEVCLRRANNPGRLNGVGVAVVNPPYTLAKDLDAIAPYLKARLTSDPSAKVSTRWLVAETAEPASPKQRRRPVSRAGSGRTR